MDKLFDKVKDAVLEKVEASQASHHHGGGSGYSGHGGRPQDTGHCGHAEDSRRDDRGYSREEGYERRRDDDRSYDDRERRNQDEYGGSGYGGHGGRPQSTRHEDVLDSTRREYRPAQQSGVYPPHRHDDDRSEARHVAEKHSSSQESSFFSSALSFLHGKERQFEAEDIDEKYYVDRHRKVYSNEEVAGSSKSIGTAAAMQALKIFIGGKGETAKRQDSNAFIGLAMAECVKLFDQQSSKGQLEQGANKQDAVNIAAQMALKLFLKSKVDAAGGSGGNMLMSLANQLMK